MSEEWEFDAEACCKAMQDEMQWEFEQMMKSDMCEEE